MLFLLGYGNILDREKDVLVPLVVQTAPGEGLKGNDLPVHQTKLLF